MQIPALGGKQGYDTQLRQETRLTKCTMTKKKTQQIKNKET